MENIVSLAWPIASVIIALSLRSTVALIVKRRGQVDFSFKDFKFGARSATELPQHDGDMPKSLPRLAEKPVEPADSSAEQKEIAVVENEGDEGEEETEYFFTTEDPEKLDNLFLKFKATDQYRNNVGFWESVYVKSRCALGLDEYIPSLTKLSQMNPDWPWPGVFIIQRFISLSDFEEAEKHLLIYLQNDKFRGRFLEQGVDLYYLLQGEDRALQFIKEQSSRSSEVEISEMFSRLAAKLKDQKHRLSYFLYQEIAFTLKKPDSDEKFSLAYAYSNLNELEILGYRHYSSLVSSEPEWSGPPNNLGVSVPDRMDSLKNEFFEEGIRLGNPLAAANLVKRLVGAGFISRAREIVDDFDDRAGADEVFAEAKAQLLSAEKVVEENKKKLDSFSQSQYQRYKATVMQALKYFLSDKYDLSVGIYANSDRSVQVFISSDTCACRVMFGEKFAEGILNREGVGFNGVVTLSGSTILGTSTTRLFVFPTSSNKAKVIQFPDRFDDGKEIKVIDIDLLAESPRLLNSSSPVANINDLREALPLDSSSPSSMPT